MLRPDACAASAFSNTPRVLLAESTGATPTVLYSARLNLPANAGVARSETTATIDAILFFFISCLLFIEASGPVDATELDGRAGGTFRVLGIDDTEHVLAAASQRPRSLCL